MRVAKSSFKTALWIVLATLVLALGVAGVLGFRALQYPHVAHAGSGKAIVVEVTPDMSFTGIATALHAEGVITQPRLFRVYGMYRGATRKVRAGRYELADNLTPKQVLDVLVAGVKEKTIKVTLPEGKHMLEYFDILEAAGVGKRRELQALAQDAAFLKTLQIEAPSIEGYLFPDTYDFPLNQPAEKILQRLVARYRVVWREVAAAAGPALAETQRRMGWDEHKLLIMASLVEKEAVLASEQPRIAQVFYNRLTSATFVSKRLETDPTIRYGCMVGSPGATSCKNWKITDRLRTLQLRDATNTYNTYQHAGLPPGPICSPGRGAMLAAMQPDGSGFFYFVGRNDGSHVFSKTFAEHSAAVDTYQR